jgi:spermidine synthase
MVQPFGPEPRAYYAPLSPLSRVVRVLPENARLAVVGLGTGSIAYYARPGQTLRFYEIDPIIEPLARRWFTFLRDTKATVDLELGDARLTLRDAPDGSLDFLLVDAFSSDAIPVHLLTVEAIELYFHKLKPNGILLLHISNRHLHVVRVVRALAHQLGLASAHIDYNPSEDQASAVEAAALARTREPLQPLLERGWSELGPGREVLWTDDRSNLLSLLGE